MQVLAVAPAVQVAMLGILTTVITTVGIVAVAIMNNRRERGAAATTAMEDTLRERIVLRDEQIQDLRNDIAEKDREIEKLVEELQLYRDGRIG